MLEDGAGFWDLPSTSLQVEEGGICSSQARLLAGGMDHGGAQADSRSRVSKGPRPQAHLIRCAPGIKLSQLTRCVWC